MDDMAWGIEQAEAIERDLQRRFGPGWGLLPEHARKAYRAERILYTITAQLGSEFDPAQELIGQVLAAFPKVLG